MMAVPISELQTSYVTGDLEYPATDPLITTQSTSGSTFKYIMSDMLDFGLQTQQFVTYQSCKTGTTANLTATYSNGVAGVSATLTNSGTLTSLTIDTVALSINDRVLVKDQISSLENGIYIVTTVGSATTAWVLTRAQDFDQTVEIIQYSAVLVTQGSGNAGNYFQQVNAAPITIGVSAINFDLFFNPSVYLNGVTGTGEFVGSNGATLIAPNLGTPASGNLSNCTGINVSSATGILPVLNGGTGVTTSTGTGSTVLNVSPTLTTPRINQINDTNGNANLAISAAASAVNYMTSVNSATGGFTGFEVTGADTNADAYIKPKGDAGFAVVTSAVAGVPFAIYSGTAQQHVTTFNFSNTNATRAVTFQDANGTVAYLSDITSNYLKAWVNFDGTTSPGTIRASLNVSSVTVTGTGQYTVNFTSSLANTNYATTIGYDVSANASYQVAPTVYLLGKAVGSIGLYCAAGNNGIYSFTVVNHSDLNLAIFNT
jgi:hypothetical protein